MWTIDRHGRVAKHSAAPTIDPATAATLIRERCYRDLGYFARTVWPVLEPSTPLIWNWHLEIIFKTRQRQIEGDPAYRKTLYCVPPGSMKSLAISVISPAWEWLRDPHRRKINLSNDDKLVSRDSRRMRELLRSDLYQALITHAAQYHGKPAWTLAQDQNEKVNFENTARGFRQALSMGASIIGKRGDDIDIDDPIDANDVIHGSVEQVAKRLHYANTTIEKTLPSRVNRLDAARWTLIMQRLHSSDPAGRILEREREDWHVVNLQMEFEPDNPLNHPNDPRTERGELLCPALYPRAEIERLKIKLGNEYWAQYQQDPRPGDRAVLKRQYWRFWYPHTGRVPKPVTVRMPDGTLHECPQVRIPRVLHSLTQSWDCAFKDTKDSAYVVGQVWGAEGADSYLLDQVRDKLDVVATIAAIRALSKRWPQAIKKLIEDKANGPAVIRMLRNTLAGILEVNPAGGKEARMNAAAPVARSGNVYLPHPDLFPWVEGFIAECESAPFGSYMDQVDTFTQYVNHRFGDGSALLDALLAG